MTLKLNNITEMFRS